MKRLILLLFLAASFSSYGQKTIPYIVNEWQRGANPVPSIVNTVLPVISGSDAFVGTTLTTTDGTWTGSPSSFTYQWTRAGTNIGSATNSTYLLAVADVGQLIRCVVTGHKVGTTDVFATSNGITGDQYTLVYLPILGQSQAGGYNASPALTTGSVSNVYTLTSGPIDCNPAGNLIALVEGDTFSDTLIGGGGPGATANVETIATSMCQQLNTYTNDVHFKYASTIHATGGTTIQQLMNGGGSGQYEELIVCTARMKTLADANGWAFNTHLVFFHGATGDNVTTTYKAKLQQLYTDWVASIASYTTQTNKYLFTHQQRPAGTPDYGQQQFEQSLTNTSIVVVSPEYKAAYQGDAIHLTNHGERYMAMNWARAINKKLTSSFVPMQLDITNATVNAAGTVITVPFLGTTGTISGTTNLGTQLFSSTTSAIIATTAAITSGNLVLTITAVDKMPIGSHNLLIRTGVAANGEMHDSSTDTPAFNDTGGSPYVLQKYIVRAEAAKTLVFPVNAILSFGGTGSQPGVTTIYEIWDDSKATTTEIYTLQGNVALHALNTASNYWGFTASGSKSGTQASSGTNIYPNTYLTDFWFVENKNVDNKIVGLNPAKTYTIKFGGLRTGTATLRTTIITIGGTSISKTSNCSTSTACFPLEANKHVFNGVAPNGSGEITFNVNQNSTQFGYVNVIEIIQE